MGWFSKKEGKSEASKQSSLQLPKLPDLPELPPLNENKKKDSLSQLPSFPNNSFGDNFSRSTIKDAVTGKHKDDFDSQFPEGKRGDRVLRADDFVPSIKDRKRKMPKTPQPPKDYSYPRTQEIEDEEDFNAEEEFEEPEFDEYEEDSSLPTEAEFEESNTSEFEPRGRSAPDEPVFIRIDKFEDAMKVFEKTRHEIADIEKALKDITAVREDEDKELEEWQRNIVKIKEQIEKVDEDIFSKID